MRWGTKSLLTVGSAHAPVMLRLKRLKSFFSLWIEKVALILAIVLDLASMNLYRYASEQSLKDFIYFSGQSLAVTFYITAIVVFTKGKFLPNLIASAWLPFAINDNIEELFFDNTNLDWVEFACFGLAIIVILYKIKKHKS